MEKEHGLSKEASGKLFEPVVAGTLGAEQNLPDVVTQLWLAPIIPSRLLGAGCLPFPSRLEECGCGCGVESRIVARRQSVPLYRSARTGILVHECSRHLPPL